MKKDQKPSHDLRDLLRIKEPSDRGGKKPILKKTHQFTIWYFVIAIIIVLFIQSYMSSRKTEDVISYSEFKELLRTGKIQNRSMARRKLNKSFRPSGWKTQTW
jgi:hypothetical protein